MAINTAGDLIALALRTAGVLGVGQASSAEDATDALVLLGLLVAGWQRKRWLVPSLTDVPITATGAASYAIGPPRQTRLQAAYARILPAAASPVDITLGIIGTREEYSAIALKSLSTFPAVAYLDPAAPAARVYVWPIPPANAFELHFVFPAALPVYARLTDPIALPAEYIEALLWSLTVRLAMTYGLPTRPDHVAAMSAALHTIRVANTQIARLALPAGVGPSSGGSGGTAAASAAFQSGMW